MYIATLLRIGQYIYIYIYTSCCNASPCTHKHSSCATCTVYLCGHGREIEVRGHGTLCRTCGALLRRSRQFSPRMAAACACHHTCRALGLAKNSCGSHRPTTAAVQRAHPRPPQHRRHVCGQQRPLDLQKHYHCLHPYFRALSERVYPGTFGGVRCNPLLFYSELCAMLFQQVRESKDEFLPVP